MVGLSQISHLLIFEFALPPPPPPDLLGGRFIRHGVPLGYGKLKIPAYFYGMLQGGKKKTNLFSAFTTPGSFSCASDGCFFMNPVVKKLFILSDIARQCP
jgi:hypothetical protein